MGSIGYRPFAPLRRRAAETTTNRLILQAITLPMVFILYVYNPAPLQRAAKFAIVCVVKRKSEIRSLEPRFARPREAGPFAPAPAVTAKAVTARADSREPRYSLREIVTSRAKTPTRRATACTAMGGRAMLVDWIEGCMQSQLTRCHKVCRAQLTSGSRCALAV